MTGTGMTTLLGDEPAANRIVAQPRATLSPTSPTCRY